MNTTPSGDWHYECGCIATAIHINFCGLHNAARDLAGWAEDAAHLLELYFAYGEEMRKIGRGFSGSGLLGHSAEDVAKGLRVILDRLDTIRQAKGESA